MAANALKKITNRAKEIVRKSPGTKWVNAVKKAGAEYRSGKISGVKKKGVTKKARKISGAKKKTATRTRRSIGAVTPVTGGNLEGQLRHRLKEQLGWCLASRETAKTKTEKNKLSRKAVEIRKKLRALS